MSAPVRFLGVCALVWVAFRAGAFWNPSAKDKLDGQPVAAIVPPASAMPAPFADQVPQGVPGYDGYPGYAGYAPYPQPPAPAYPAYTPVPVRIPVYVPAYYPQRPAPPGPRPPLDLDFTALPPAENWSLASLPPDARTPRAASTPAPSAPTAATLPPKLDRLQLSSWALLRGPQSTPTLATGGMLGGSQAGMRLTYAFDRRLAAQLRTSTPVGGGGRGAEIALGARYQPLRSIPVWINAERRQAIGDYGRSAFALFAEGGLYQQPLPWAFSLDAYLQGGVVGASHRDLFVDGAMTVSRPLFRNYSIGAGVWGGAQPGVHRVDAGPRLSMKVRDNIRVHADWRQRLLGKADPGSGPALTLAADF